MVKCRRNVHPFFGTSPLKCNENSVFFFKITQNKVKDLFFLTSSLFVMLCLVVVLIF